MCHGPQDASLALHEKSAAAVTLHSQGFQKDVSGRAAQDRAVLGVSSPKKMPVAGLATALCEGVADRRVRMGLRPKFWHLSQVQERWRPLARVRSPVGNSVGS